MRAAIGQIALATVLSVFFAAATVIPAALADSRNDSHDRDHDRRDDDRRDHDQDLKMLKEQIKALKRRVDELKGRASSAPLTAFDVDGTPVGAVVGIDRDNIPWVVMMAEDAASPPQSYTFALRVLRDEFQGAKVWYSLPDCMGTAYLEPRGGFIGGDLGPNSIAIAGVDYVRVPAIYYAAAAGADLIDVQVASTPLADGRCSNSPLGTELRRVVAATLVTLDTPSTAPYMVGPTSTSP